MQRHNISLNQTEESVLATNKVLRNTYMLLGLTLLFSAGTAAFAMMTNARPLGFLPMIILYFGLLFATQALRNSAWGLVMVFALTGFLGYTIGPLVNSIIGGYSNGSQIVMTALGSTGIIFFALSGYVLTTKKDFSYLGGFLLVGLVAAFLAIIANVFFQIPGLHLAISSIFVLISSGMILFQTSQIINGGERNYIMATITLYVALYNLFISLLQLFSALSGRD